MWGRRGMHGAAWGFVSGLRGGVRKCSRRACRCAGAGADLRRGMGREVGGRLSAPRGRGGRARAGRVVVRGREQIFGGECVVRSAGVHRRGAGMWQEGRGRACRYAGAGAGLRRGMCCEGGGCASGLRGGAEVCRGGRRSSAGNGLWGRRGLTHIRRCRSRVRVLLYIRPPRHRREIAAMGTKDVPCEHPSPAKTSAPAPSAFIFPPRRSPSPTKPSAASRRMTFALAAATFTLPRPRSHFPRMAFGDAHEDFGIPQ